MRTDRKVLLEVVVERDAVIDVLEELDVLLQVFQVQFLLRFVEKRPVSLVSFEPSSLLLESEDRLLGSLHARVELGDLTGMKVKVALVLALHVLKALTVIGQALRMLDDEFVTVVDLVNEKIALLLVRLLKLTQLRHHILGMRLQVLENFDLDVVLFGYFLHATLDRLVFVVHLVL